MVQGGIPLVEWREHEPAFEEPMGDIGMAPAHKEVEEEDEAYEFANAYEAEPEEDEQNEPLGDVPPNEEQDVLCDDDATEVWDGFDNYGEREDLYGDEGLNEPDDDANMYEDADKHECELGAALGPDLADMEVGQENPENDGIHKQEEEEIQFVEEQPVRMHGYGLRSTCNRLLGYCFSFKEEETEGANGVAFLQEAKQICNAEEFEPQSMHLLLCIYLFTQMSAKHGICKHIQAAIQALIEDIAQFEATNVFCSPLATKLTQKQHHATLRIINIIKEKRRGALKRRACADGRPQWAYYTKEETSLPTLSINVLMLSLIIDAAESCDVAVADVART